MKKITIKTFGCKVNQYNSQLVSQKLKDYFQIESKWKNSDIVIVNACVVTEKAEREVISLVKKIQKFGIQEIYVMGCCSSICKKELQTLSVDCFKEKELMNEILKKYKVYQENFDNIMISEFGRHTRAFVKIQSGCNQFCSYCIVPFVRGPLVSRSSTSILSEIEGLVNNGFKEIVLTGTQVGLYKDPKNDKCCFYELLEIIGKKFSNYLYRVRISSIGLNFVKPDYIRLVNTYPIFCNHLHISLQSGSNRILDIMNRQYTVEEYRKTVNNLKENIADFQISTDIIVGFPGETESDFQETVDFANKMEFSKIHVFQYSPRIGTKAASFKDQIDIKTKKYRSSKLLAIESSIRYTIQENYIGKAVQILLESNGTGLTRNYLRVRLQNHSDEIDVGELYKVIVSSIDVNCLYAKLKGVDFFNGSSTKKRQ
ncbi:MAG: MiaB/RimO family radical SAM methylthiotransferase [Caldisericia bacterium]|nr:MiaB/RimO family radical SAM methylthiotransferase [Caldisericia bacterium]